MTEILLSIVLGLEAILVSFVSLTAFGMRALDPLPAFLGGALFIAALIIVAGLLRYRWGLWLGWVLQALLIATGILLPAMFVVGTGFAAIWVYCFLRGRQIDRNKAQFNDNPSPV
ncbi:MAG: DUF4233 domain-containing protein [Salinibacterium sp.]|nr:DUF4233 domain-containing protein [Salinibacterium sp.]